MDYSTLLERERQAVALLERKLAERRARLAALEAAWTPSDEFDRLLDQEVAGEVAQSIRKPREDGRVQLIAPDRRSRGGSSTGQQVPERLQPVLAFIGFDGRTLEEVANFMVEHHMVAPGKTDPVRKAMFDLRARWNIIESPRRGFYRVKPPSQESGPATVGVNDAEKGAGEHNPETNEAA